MAYLPVSSVPPDPDVDLATVGRSPSRTAAGDSSGYTTPVRTPDLTVLTEGARKCADTTTVDSSQRSHEAAQEQVHREHGG